MKRTSALATTAIAMLSVAALVGCTPGGGGESGEETTTVRVGFDTPQSLDPHLALSLPDYQSNRLSYDTLLRRDAEGVVAGLAESWKGGGANYEFTIRDGALCSDGTPITAQIVTDSLRSYVENTTPSSVIQTFGGLAPEISADDDAGTVSIVTEVPWSDLLFGLTVANTGIICPAGLADLEALNTGRVEGAESGPYILESAEPGVKYTYKLRDDYDWWPDWETELPGEVPETIVYTVATDPSASANQVIDGQLDLARIMPDSKARFSEDGDIKLASFPFGNFYVLFNERPGAVFADEANREALAQVLDREAFDKTTTDGTGEITDTFGSKATACATTDPRPDLTKYDPEAGAATLAGLDIRILGAQVVGTAGAGNVYLEEVLREAGANVTLDNVDIGTWAGRTFGQPETWDVTIYPDLNFSGTLMTGIGNFLGADILEGGGNIGGTNAPDAEAINAERAKADTPEATCAIDAETVAALVEGGHMIPLTVESFIYAERPGFTVNMLGGSLDDHIFRITI